MLRGRGTGASKKTRLWEGRRVGTHCLSPPSTVITQMGMGEKMVDLCVCTPPKPHIEKSIFGHLALPPPSVLLNACGLFDQVS